MARVPKPSTCIEIAQAIEAARVLRDLGGLHAERKNLLSASYYQMAAAALDMARGLALNLDYDIPVNVQVDLAEQIQHDLDMAEYVRDRSSSR